jgi:hypothetical protein
MSKSCNCILPFSLSSKCKAKGHDSKTVVTPQASAHLETRTGDLLHLEATEHQSHMISERPLVTSECQAHLITWPPDRHM